VAPAALAAAGVASALVLNPNYLGEVAAALRGQAPRCRHPGVAVIDMMAREARAA
jgi:hypothetical protein